MAPRVSKKRAISPEKQSVTEPGSKVSAPPTNEKPAKRPRSSTIGTQETVAVSAPEKSKIAEPETNDGPEGPSEDEPEEEVPKLVGTFDLYGTDLEFLNKVYSPAGQNKVFPEKLYNEILTYQAKNDRTAKVTIPAGFATGADGKFRSGIFRDPMEESPFDIVALDIKEVKELEFVSKFGRPADAWEGPGLKARLEIEDGGCGISSSSGSISLKPMWKKVDKDGKLMELFEGTFTFKVSYSSMYSRKGHGTGQGLTLECWAIRGKA